jgi:hypothetical protein
MVWVPGFDGGSLPGWADKVVTQMASFPRAAHDDLTDTATGALKYLRENGLLLRREEFMRDEREAKMYRSPEGALYDV